MKEEKKSRKEEEKKDPYDKLTESLMKKGGLVSAMISMQPRTEELKIERMEERKNERIQVKKEIVRKVKKNYYVSEDSVILLEVMANIEGKKQGELIEEIIIDRFKKAYPTYDKLDQEVFKQKYFPKLSKKTQEELKDILES